VLKEISPGPALIKNTEYTYNTLGQVKTKDTPDGGKFAYDYNDDGSIKEVSVYDGTTKVRKLSYSYDDLGRPLRTFEYYGTNFEDRREVNFQVYDDIEDVKMRRIFSGIDAAHRARIENTRGRVSAVISYNYSGTSKETRTEVGELFSYDDEGRLRFKITTIQGIPGIQETWYEYDTHGKVTADFCFYGGKIIKKSYSYDALGRLHEVYHSVTTDGGQNYTNEKIAGYHYDDLGMMDGKNFSKITGGYGVGYGYDIKDRLEVIAGTANKPGFAEAITSYTPAGNIHTAEYKYFTSGLADPDEDYHMTYGYDHVSRLETVTPTSDASHVTDFSAFYTYDKLGRFQSKTEGSNSTITGYGHYIDNSRLKEVVKNGVKQEYVYDAFGNMIVDFSKKMVIEYDWRNMPVAYRFYSELPTDITRDNSGTCLLGDLYQHMEESDLNSAAINLVSTVYMYYDASGNRVGKIEVKES
jgi:YD repeat-containing protein